MGSLPATQHRPGIMVVNPRLHDATPRNAEMFRKWTRLHFRDLLDIPETEECRRMSRTLRFAAASDTNGQGKEKYGHTSSQESAYFYTIFAPTLSTFQSPPYYALSRRLDLENTRELQEGEEPVECEKDMMVWDVVDAKFSIYEEVESNSKYRAYADLPTQIEGGARLVGLSFDSKAGLEQVQRLQAGLIECLTAHGSSSATYTSLYRNAGAESQPEMHPVIGSDAVGGGEWLVLIAIQSKRDVLKDKDDEEIIKDWLDGGNEMGMEIGFGIWACEVDMS